MNKIATWFVAYKTKFSALRAKLAKAFSLISDVPSVMGREEADQTNARLKAMQKHSEEAPSQPKLYSHLKAVASHTDLDSVNIEHWFEKPNQPYGEAKSDETQKKVTNNRLMSQSKMTHTRLNAYIDTIKKDTDNEIDRDAHAESEN
jgi:hypothetical protein